MGDLTIGKYKGYSGSYKYVDGHYFGKITDIKDLITFQTRDPFKLVLVFEEAVRDYIELCDIVGK